MKRVSAIALGVALLVLAAAPGRGSDDKTGDALAKAKAKFEADMTKARAAAKVYFDGREKKARDKGDKKLVDVAKDERKAFDDHGVLAATGPKDLQRQVTAPRTAIEKAYTLAIKEYTKAKKDDLAAAADQE
ncbi:hypothetical protein [Fimbriiglobus ruber]|uniref:Uncharacterized protein n=1 Tax=Fimbriiglobus ruber TaxID=1908690 RepID=A0A225D7G9_9BACT|nr:hypothetical protein [Fimbriiglobus ruber]OWK35584.1 hypothetical protein FRUB_08147 [Fimbriiglobus ruber]